MSLKLMEFFQDGNPGAMTALSVLYYYKQMKPNMIDFMRSHNIKGTRLWDIYKNVCSMDDNKFISTMNELVFSKDPFSVSVYSDLEEKEVNVLCFIDRFNLC